MSSSAVLQRLLLNLWDGIRGVPVSLSRGAATLKDRRSYGSSKTTWGKLPIIRFLDCWKYEEFTKMILLTEILDKA